MTLYQALFQAEQRLKTTIAYEFSKKYGPFEDTNFTDYTEPYLDPHNFNKNIKINKDKPLEKGFYVIHQLTSVIDRYSKYPPFEHYLKKHKHIPIWVLINKLTFGETKNFYDVLKIQNSIAAEFKTKPSHLRNMIKTLHIIRNDCAHGSNFFHQIYPTLPKDIEIYQDFKKEFSFSNSSSIGNLFLVIIILKYFLSPFDFPRFCSSALHSVFLPITKLTPIAPITDYMLKQLGTKSLEDAKEKFDFLIKYRI